MGLLHFATNLSVKFFEKKLIWSFSTLNGPPLVGHHPSSDWLVSVVEDLEHKARKPLSGVKKPSCISHGRDAKHGMKTRKNV